MDRIVSWFSCGAASAVATKLVLIDNDVTINYCEVEEEHPDNERFLKDCENWFGQKINIMGADEYQRSIHKVFEKKRYLCGVGGAPCTKALKKQLRLDTQLANDIQVFGYTVEEQHRVDRFIDANNEVHIITPLIDRGLTKQDCLAMIVDANIDLPEMYLLGYKNNNCRGCVKASSPKYWAKIKQDFKPEFDRMVRQEENIGASICKIDLKTVKKRYPEKYNELGEPAVKNETGGATYWRPRLSELPSDIEPMDDTVDIQCGIFCQIAEGEYNG